MLTGTVRFVNLETIIHGVMIVFGFASLGLVSHFFYQTHSIGYVAWALGVALGSVLIVTAIMLTKVDREHEPETFWTLLFVVVVASGLSGTVQSWAYAQHLVPVHAAILGYGLPLVGEALLAYGASLYTQAQRRKQIRHITDNTQAVIASAIAEALGEISVPDVQQYVEGEIERIVRFQVRQVTAMMMNDSGADRTQDLNKVAPPNQIAGSLDVPVLGPLPSSEHSGLGSGSTSSSDAIQLNNEPNESGSIRSTRTESNHQPGSDVGSGSVPSNREPHDRHSGSTSIPEPNLDESVKLSKAEVLERMVTVYAAQPQATLEELAVRFQRSKSTISTYRSELVAQHQVRVTKDAGTVVITQATEHENGVERSSVRTETVGGGGDGSILPSNENRA